MNNLPANCLETIFKHFLTPQEWYSGRAVSRMWNMTGTRSMSLKVAETVLPRIPTLYSLQTTEVQKNPKVLSNLLSAQPEFVKNSPDLQKNPLYIHTACLANFLANAQLYMQDKPRTKYPDPYSRLPIDGRLDQLPKERLSVILNSLNLPKGSIDSTQPVQVDVMIDLLKNEKLEDEKLAKLLIEMAGPIAFKCLSETVKNSVPFALWMIDTLQQQGATWRQIIHLFVSEVGPDVLNDEEFGRHALQIQSTPINEQLSFVIFCILGKKLKNTPSFLLYALNLFSKGIREDILKNPSIDHYGIDPSMFDSETFGAALVSIDFACCKYLSSRLKNNSTFMTKLLTLADTKYKKTVILCLEKPCDDIISNIGPDVRDNAVFGLTALAIFPGYVEFLSSRLLNDPNFIQKALEIAFNYAPRFVSRIIRSAGPIAQKDEQCSLLAATLYPDCFDLIDLQFQQSVVFVQKLLKELLSKSSPDTLSFIFRKSGPNVKKDLECARIVTMNNIDIFHEIDPTLQNNVLFVREILKQFSPQERTQNQEDSLKTSERKRCLLKLLSSMGPNVHTDPECQALVISFFPESMPLKHLVDWYSHNPNGNVFEHEEMALEAFRFERTMLFDLSPTLFQSIPFVKELCKHTVAISPSKIECEILLAMIMERAGPTAKADPDCQKLHQKYPLRPMCTIS